mmetsp:Transcript_16919/g.26652  ORF Transcript_16919/g.26652 Transcript_16919/m.26652 type:complete len:400 (+) Transcript_16919:50-1249(+)
MLWSCRCCLIILHLAALLLNDSFFSPSRFGVYAFNQIGKPRLLTSQTTKEEWLKRRQDIQKTFRDQVYGAVPSVPYKLQFDVRQRPNHSLQGKAILYLVGITISTDTGSFSFPFHLFVPETEKDKQFPAFILVWNRETLKPLSPDSEYWPVEQLVDSGFATATFWAGDVDPDDQIDDFQNGIHPLFDQGNRYGNSWGAIAAWAFGASRILDCLEQHFESTIDPTKVAVVGHSRGGKTALWAAAEDERFALAISNNSGCTGAALSKRKQGGNFGETVMQINNIFPNWFCKNYRLFNGKEEELPVDQHMLLALIAPRALAVASATLDDWADPLGEYLSTRDASQIWSLHGIDSTLPENQPEPESPIRKGKVQYHLRSGFHDLNLYDWKQYISMAKYVFGSK